LTQIESASIGSDIFEGEALPDGAVDKGEGYRDLGESDGDLDSSDSGDDGGSEDGGSERSDDESMVSTGYSNERWFEEGAHATQVWKVLDT
jgi:hypothetical protein